MLCRSGREGSGPRLGQIANGQTLTAANAVMGRRPLHGTGAKEGRPTHGADIYALGLKSVRNGGGQAAKDREPLPSGENPQLSTLCAVSWSAVWPTIPANAGNPPAIFVTNCSGRRKRRLLQRRWDRAGCGPWMAVALAASTLALAARARLELLPARAGGESFARRWRFRGESIDVHSFALSAERPLSRHRRADERSPPASALRALAASSHSHCPAPSEGMYPSRRRTAASSDSSPTANSRRSPWPVGPRRRSATLPSAEAETGIATT